MSQLPSLLTIIIPGNPDDKYWNNRNADVRARELYHRLGYEEDIMKYVKEL